MTSYSPRLVAERQARRDALGPLPPWWRPFARRKWWRERAAIEAMDVSQNAEMLRHLYPARSVEQMAAHSEKFTSLLKEVRKAGAKQRFVEAIRNGMPPGPGDVGEDERTP